MPFKATEGWYEIKNKDKIIIPNDKAVRPSLIHHENKYYYKYKSKWEMYLMMELDSIPSVLRWGYEVQTIPYFDHTTNKNRLYFIDFTVMYDNGDIYLIEVKPFNETQEPMKPKRGSKGKSSDEILCEKKQVYHKNIAKWKFATEWCKYRTSVDSIKWIFEVYTEKTGLKNIVQKYSNRK